MNRLQELAGILQEADIRTLRRVVILAIFTSNIPNEMEVAFKKRISSDPDADIIKANKKFLEQLLEDKASLMNDPNYAELKQDGEFLRLSKSVVNALNTLNKAGDLNFGNIAYAKPLLGRSKLSYSTVLYIAAEGEVKNLENYLHKEYGPDFVFNLLKTKEMGPKTTNDPTIPAAKPTAAAPASKPELTELGQAELEDMIKPGYLPSAEFDKKYNTRLSKAYKFPLDSNIVQSVIDKAINDKSIFNNEEYQKDINNVYDSLVRANGDVRVKVKDTEDKWDVIYGMLSHLNPNDIKYMVENPASRSKDETEKVLPVERAYDKYKVGINWIPSPKSWEIIKNILTTKYPDIKWPLEDLMEEVKSFFKLVK